MFSMRRTFQAETRTYTKAMRQKRAGSVLETLITCAWLAKRQETSQRGLQDKLGEAGRARPWKDLIHNKEVIINTMGTF